MRKYYGTIVFLGNIISFIKYLLIYFFALHFQKILLSTDFNMINSLLKTQYLFQFENLEWLNFTFSDRKLIHFSSEVKRKELLNFTFKVKFIQKVKSISEEYSKVKFKKWRVFKVKFKKWRVFRKWSLKSEEYSKWSLKSEEYSESEV